MAPPYSRLANNSLNFTGDSGSGAISFTENAAFDFNKPILTKTLSMNGATSGALTITPAAVTSSYSLTLPSSQGASNTVMVNDGTGSLSWVSKESAGGTGDVVGPSSSTANGIARFSSSTGKLLKNSGVTITDTADIAGAKTLALSGSTSGALTIQPAAATTDHIITMPAEQGAAGTYLKNDGTGSLSWSTTGVTVTAGSGLSGGGSISLGGSATLDVNVDNSTIEVDLDTLRLKNSGVTAAKIADSTITNAKLANPSLTVTAGSGLSGGGSVSLGGSTTIDVNVDSSTIEINLDTLRLKDLGVTTGKINDGAVTAAKIADSTITNAKLANSSLTVTAGSGLSGGGSVALGGSATLDVNVDDSTIEINLDTLRLKDSGVTAAKIADSTITNAKLANSSLTVTAGNGLSGGGSVTLGGSATLDVNVDNSTIEINLDTLRLKDLGVTTGKINDAAVTNAKLANSSITVTAGDGLQNGGSVSLGSSVSIALDGTVVRTSGTQSIGGAKTFTSALAISNTLAMNGATSGTLTIQPAATTSSHTITLPSAQGSADTYLKNDGTGGLSWASLLAPSSSNNGDVVGPASSTANALARYDATTGKVLKNSGVTLSDTADIAGVYTLAMTASTSGTLTIQPAATTTTHTITMPSAQGAANTYLKNNGAGSLTWSTTGTGDASGPSSSTNQAIARFDGTTGKLIQNSTVTLNNIGQFNYVDGINFNYATGNASVTNVKVLTLRGNTTGNLGLYAADSTTTHTYYFPSDQGSAGTYFRNDGTGILTWTDPRDDLRLWYFDQFWTPNNGPLGFQAGGSVGATVSAVASEANHIGITRIASNSTGSNGNGTYAIPQVLLWENIKYVEFVFRPWPTGTSTNSAISVGSLASRTSLAPGHVCLTYSTALSAEGWCVKVNDSNFGVQTYSFSSFSTQNVGAWLKFRLTNTNDTGSFTATLSSSSTSETISSGAHQLNVGTGYLIGIGVSCISGTATKTVEVDSCEFQMKGSASWG
jgi:hypothetical protein